MINNYTAVAHVQAAEHHLAEVERTLPDITEEGKVKLAMAGIHMQIAKAYQIQDLQNEIYPILQPLETALAVGLKAINDTLGDFYGRLVYPPIKRPWWKPQLKLRWNLRRKK